MKYAQRAALAVVATTLSLGLAAAPAFAADAMHGDAMHKTMKKHGGMTKKSMMHKDTMSKEAEPAQ